MIDDGRESAQDYNAQVPRARPVVAPVDVRAEHPMLLARLSPGSAGVDCVAFITGAVVLTFLLAGPFSGLAESQQEIDERVLNLLFTMARAILLIGALAIVVGRRGQGAASLGLCVECWWKTGVWGLAAAAGGFAALILAVLLVTFVWPDSQEAFRRNPETIFEHLPRLHPLWLCSISAFVGFYEELIFRGFLLTRIRRATGSGVLAVVISSALFAIAHVGTQENATLFPIFALGSVWAILSLWLRSVVPAVIGHWLFNSAQFLTLYYWGTGWE